jgi:AcrR family transcriptional regulator
MGKVEEKKKLKQKNIVDAALDLFLEKGYHACRIEDIVALAGVGKGTFYLYFKNKEELVESLVEQFVTDLMGTLLWVEEQSKKGVDLRNVFKEQGERMAETFKENKRLGQFFYREGRAVSPKIDNMVKEFLAQLSQTSTFYFENAIKEGKMDKNLNPKMVAMVVIGGVTFTYQQWIEGIVDDPVDQIVDGLLTIYLNALGFKL